MLGQKFSTSRVSARSISAAPRSSVVMHGSSQLTAEIASLERQIKDANSEARKAPLIAKLNSLRGGVSFSNKPTASKIASLEKAFSAPAVSDKELAQQIASLEKQIKDANSEARKAPLIAKLNALRVGSSFSASPAAATAKRTISPVSAPVLGDKELAQQISSLERQIKDANSEARKAPLIAKLNALKGGASFSAPSAAAPKPSTAAYTPSASFSAPVADKEVAAKIAALERQIKDANSEARKAPLIAQLNALRSGASSFSSPTAARAVSAAAEPSAFYRPSSTSTVVKNKEVAAKIASLEKQIKDANSEARKAPLRAQLNALYATA